MSANNADKIAPFYESFTRYSIRVSQIRGSAPVAIELPTYSISAIDSICMPPASI